MGSIGGFDWGFAGLIGGFDWGFAGLIGGVDWGFAGLIGGFDWRVRGFDWWVRLGVREILGDYVTVLDEGVVQECVVVRPYFGALHFD